MRICKICGEKEDEHHAPDWLEIPDGCVCDWGTWDFDMAILPPVCNEYQGDGKENCRTCEHNKDCHVI